MATVTGITKDMDVTGEIKKNKSIGYPGALSFIGLI